MGTRHLIAVYKDGQPKIAQYGQWDGYPTGQGYGVFLFLTELMSSPNKLPAFTEKVSELTFHTEESYLAILKEYWEKDGDGFCLSYGSPEKAYWDEHMRHLSRDAGSDILQIVMDSKVPLVLQNNIDFAGDGLFCEWAYVIDLDSERFEVYMGGSKSPREGRFVNAADPTAEYPAVGLVAKFKFNEFPLLTIDEFYARIGSVAY